MKHLAAVNAAQIAGFSHFANALLELYFLAYPESEDTP